MGAQTPRRTRPRGQPAAHSATALLEGGEPPLGLASRLRGGGGAEKDAPKRSSLTVVVASALGWVILVGAVVTRWPQAWKVWRARSAVGLNPLMLEIEMFGYVVCVLNGLRLKLPVDVWGENLFHSSFGIATTLMLYAFAAPGSLEAVSFARKAAMCGGLAAIIVTGLTDILPSKVVHALYDAQNIAFIISRSFQIRTNYVRGGTGQLSVITRAALFVGNLIRIFTTIVKKGGAPMVFGHGSSAVVNGTILAQCLWCTRHSTFPPSRLCGS